jgi:hypothetical protein
MVWSKFPKKIGATCSSRYRTAKFAPRPRAACPYHPLGRLLPLHPSRHTSTHTPDCASWSTPPPVARIHPSRCPTNARCWSRRRQGLDLRLHQGTNPAKRGRGPWWPDLALAPSPALACVDEAEVAVGAAEEQGTCAPRPSWQRRVPLLPRWLDLFSGRQ